MKRSTGGFSSFAIAAAFSIITSEAHGQQIPLPTSPAEVPGPATGTAMTKAYVESVGRLAYVWGWPLVNSHNRRAAFAKAPEPGLNGGVLPVAPTGRIAMLSDYIKPDQNFVDVHQPGRSLRSRVFRARQRSGGLPGT